MGSRRGAERRRESWEGGRRGGGREEDGEWGGRGEGEWSGTTSDYHVTMYNVGTLYTASTCVVTSLTCCASQKHDIFPAAGTNTTQEPNKHILCGKSTQLKRATYFSPQVIK